jgi:class 3 adenylate cyclase
MPLSTAVTELGGKIAKKLGDGLMALFGYPVAQENDAERAVRAALAIQRSLSERNRKNDGTGKPALAARIAIDAGPVVVDAAGEIFGDVPNVAARVQARSTFKFSSLTADQCAAPVTKKLALRVNVRGNSRQNSSRSTEPCGREPPWGRQQKSGRRSRKPPGAS